MTDNKSKQDSVNGVAFRSPANDAGDGENNTETKKVEIEIEMEVERDDWIPDGGWGWGVVAGAVIIHVYVGKAFDAYNEILAVFLSGEERLIKRNKNLTLL